MAQEKNIHLLEVLGYVAAVLVGLAEILKHNESLHTALYAAGMVIGIVVIVRLLAVNAVLALKHEQESHGPTKRAAPPEGPEDETVQ